MDTIKHWTSVPWDIGLETNNLSEEVIERMDPQEAEEVQEKLLPKLSNQLFEAILTGEIVALDSSGQPLGIYYEIASNRLNPLKDSTNAPELLVKAAHVHPESVNSWLGRKGHRYVWNPDFTAPEAKRTDPQELLSFEQGQMQMDTDQSLCQLPLKSDTPQPNRFALTGDHWTITYQDQTRTVNNSKGMRYIEHLIQNQGKEIHVSELFYAINPPDANAINTTHSSMTEEQLGEVGLSITDLGDAGDVLTPEGNRRIEQEIRQLQDQIDETMEFGDIEKQEMLEKKQDELVEYIQSVTGKGGRSRKAASNHTRRVDAASKAIRAAIKKIHNLHPRLGNHLQCIQLGTHYIYKPDPHTNWEPISFPRFGH